MNDVAATQQTTRRRRLIGLAVGAGLLLLAAANWHLVHVAVTSQPDCVAHLRHGESGKSGAYSAAKSSC